MKLEKFVVTGSLIPATLDEQKALPIQIIDAKAIEISGVNTNVLDVLRKTVPQIRGSNNIGVENANISGGSNSGASNVALRNVDTLVLFNGKRMAANAGAAGGGTTGVDLNMIPISAVDQIQVLTDGASALYGSDAVSGVVNIILKKDYRGAEFSSHYSMGDTDNGGQWSQKSVGAVVGAGNDKTNLLFTAEWSKSDPIWARDMTYADNPVNTASLPGILVLSGVYYQLADGLNTIPAANQGQTLAQLVTAGVYNVVPGPYQISDRSTISSAVDKRIATVSANHALSDSITFTTDFIYAQTETEYQLNPQPITTSTTTLLANGVNTINTPGVSIRNRYLGGANRIYNNTNDSYRWTAGFEGKINEYFNFNVYANYALAKQVSIGYNQILDSALRTAIVAGTFDVFAYEQNAANVAAAGIFGNSIANYKSGYHSYHAVASGKIFELPAGNIQYAAGVEYRKETLFATADLNSLIPPGGTTSLWNSGTSLAPFDGGRSAKSYFAELKVPVVKDIPGFHLLTLDGAVRHEAFSDNNDATVPKVSLAWLPLDDQLRIRATYGKSFAVPSLYNLYGPQSTGFTPDLSGVDAYNSDGTPRGTKIGFQGHQTGGSNPFLTPSKAKSYTIGFIYSPKWAKGLDITVDYFNIKQTDLVGSLAGALEIIQDVEQFGPASPYAQFVALNAFPGQAGAVAITTPGQLHPDPDKIYVQTGIGNIGSQNQHGFDVTINYELPWKQYGRFSIASSWAIIKSFTNDGNEYVGLDLYGTLPKFSAYSSVNWSYKGYGATLGYTHIKSVDTVFGPNAESGAYNTFDLQVSYDLGNATPLLKGMEFTLGCNNLTNRMPPLSDSYSSPPFDAGTYSYLGRVFYADLKIKF
ncbi:MAG: TonB-dependent receptor [Candidatus Didemnitutus sp.]|nr:TonB-dependent receptor [Candidatus Didemnitutus sp.]